MKNLTATAIELTETGLIPDWLLRAGIRKLIRSRIQSLKQADCEANNDLTQAFINGIRGAPIAINTQSANEQHYELPAAFFSLVLGRQRKYSACYWDPLTDDLDQAEINALRISSERAGLSEGMHILELGCGWGAWTLWIAQHYPGSHITGVSNSRSQRDYIISQASARGLGNVEIITADMNAFDTERQFDRVISIEMFEHMRNHEHLMSRIASWLKADGAFFMHVFCHRDTPYFFMEESESDWMSKYFFTGGMMPSDALPLYFQNHLHLLNKWRWSGLHYEKTANAWLQNMDGRKDEIHSIFSDTYGADHVDRWWIRWRIFFMSCAELFGFADGQQWWVGHYLFKKANA